EDRSVHDRIDHPAARDPDGGVALPPVADAVTANRPEPLARPDPGHRRMLFRAEVARPRALVQVEDRREHKQEHETGTRGHDGRQQHLHPVLDRTVRWPVRTSRIPGRGIERTASTSPPPRPRAIALPHCLDPPADKLPKTLAANGVSYANQAAVG